MDDDSIYKTRATLLEKIKDKYDEGSWHDFDFYYRNFIYILCRRMNLNHIDQLITTAKKLSSGKFTRPHW